MASVRDLDCGNGDGKFMGRLNNNASRRLALGLVALMALGGCVEPLAMVSKSEVGGSGGVHKVNVGGQALMIGTVAGFCVNDDQSRDTGDGAFVVMGPCGEDGGKGLIVVNVLGRDTVTETMGVDTLDSFFKSAAGRAALSSRGDAKGVEILGTMQEGGVYFVHSRDAVGPVIPDTKDDQWRAFFVVAERLVSLSQINFTDDPVPDGLIFAQLEQVARHIRDLNQ